MKMIFRLMAMMCLLITSISFAATVRYLHTDMLGSVVAESDESGNVISRSRYEPFGKRLEGNKEGIGYTGHLHDSELNLTYMQARYYDPLIGRFYSNDPIGFRDVHSFNRYAYANNNPYKYTDPTGEAPKQLGSLGSKAAITIMEAAGSIDRDTANAMRDSVDGKAKGRGKFASRKAAMTQAKKDARVPRSQPPEKVEKIKMTNNGETVKDSNGKVVYTTEYTHTTTEGNKVVIQDHSAGHEKGNVGPHHNVRPAENTSTGKVEGTQKHYEF